MNRAIALLMVAAGAWAATAADVPAVVAPFDHGLHGPALDRAGVQCGDCHRVGVGDTTPDTDATRLAAPSGVCHACHVDQLSPGMRAPSSCTTCHAGAILPADHSAGWMEAHGAASRVQSCNDCHRGSQCIDCHERREPVRYRVHDRSFLGIHGIEAMVDPGACGGCHTQSYCLACHRTGSWR